MCDARVLSRAEIKDRIAQGQLIVISDKLVLRLDKWIDRHPGGRLPILHMVGKDATDQILVLSVPSSNKCCIEGKSLRPVDILLILMPPQLPRPRGPQTDARIPNRRY